LTDTDQSIWRGLKLENIYLKACEKLRKLKYRLISISIFTMKNDNIRNQLKNIARNL